MIRVRGFKDKGARAGMLVLSGLLAMGANGYAQDPNFHIYLAFGQSNMEGQGAIEAQDKTVNSRFKVMEALNCPGLSRTKGAWYTAVPPLCRCNTGLSPADYFGRTLVDSLPADIKIGIVHVAVAGCKIELFQKANYKTYAATAPSWMTSIITEYAGNPYGRLLEIAKLAQKDGVIKGILLHQGESNVGDAQWTAKVKGIYDDLISELALDPKKVPFLAGEVVNADQNGASAGANTMIAGLPQVLPNSYVISSKGLKAGADNLHFTSAGYREFGKRYAQQMLAILAKEGPTSLRSDATTPGFALERIQGDRIGKNTSLTFEIPANAFVSLKFYSMRGEAMAELAGKEFKAGKHSVVIGSKVLPNGLYLFSLKANGNSATRKMLVDAE